ncbi:hypothetical protein SAMN06265173_104109 [Thalassovita litoralis]|uniref:Uncharacterized protein n=1 Tax=Thalassovita litoralis TaxID=1010611 RepID=A0A521BTZ1_9RHOB|nr:hypothetical protein [Thalassovita litoralis]SMO50642.1 hypothetical protein SAMN06265173_104109 [Thalassovita litoralis]
MRPYLLVSATLILLAGCVPVSVYHKAGGTLTRLQNDEVNCQVQALQKVPVNKITRITPIRTLPREVCNSRGHCRIVYMEFGGDVETYDANLPLRQKVEAQCMINKGYQQIELPICENRPTTLPGTMPGLTTNSCAVKTKTGYRAATPG